MSDFRKLVVVAAGPSDCGKSQLLWDVCIAPSPRRLSIDFNGEMATKFNPDVINCYSLDECLDALAATTKGKGFARWHIALCVAADTMPDVLPKLAKVLNPTRSSDEHKSFPIAVHGVAVDCSEAADLVPNKQADWVLAGCGFFSRGRHNRLSLFMATNRPQVVSRAVTDNADHLLVFGTQEAAPLKYWAAMTSPAIADRIATLPKYHVAWIVKNEQRVFVLDDHRDVTTVLNYAGDELALEDAPALTP